MFGIIDENKKFIAIDEKRDTLRATALMLAKKTEDTFVPMFAEENIDAIINEYDDENIETAYTGDKYVKGYAPNPDKEYQSGQREKLYVAEIDPITAHISRLKDEEQTPEIIEKITSLVVKRKEKIEEIRAKYPYPIDE